MHPSERELLRAPSARRAAWWPGYLTLALGLCLAATGYAQLAPETVERQLHIRQAEQLASGTLRVFAAVTEVQDSVAYPISTLERSMFSLFLGDDISGTLLPASSLATFSSSSPRHRRGLVIAFDTAGTAPPREQAALREAVANILPQIFGNYLTVYGLRDDGPHLITELTPERGENIKILQRQITAEASTGGRGLAGQTLCKAAGKFQEWAANLAAPASQKVLLLLLAGSQSKELTPMEQGCWQQLAAAKVTVYIISFASKGDGGNPLRSLVNATGGFVHEVASPLDTFRALSNVASNLNDEYVLEAQPAALPVPAAGSTSIALRAQASYHGNLVRSQPWPLSPAPALEAAAALGALATATDVEDLSDTDQTESSPPRLLWFGLAAACLCLVVGGRQLWQLRRTSQRCQLCRCQVAQDFTNCPLQSAACVGRLVQLAPTAAGQAAAPKALFPLEDGTYLIGSGRKCKIRLRGRGLLRHHARLTISNRRALFESLGKRADTVDGWQINEPRLLGHGAVLRLGSVILRFEAKKRL